MALRIEKAFGVKMDTLMRMQSAYDIAQTRKREKEIHVPTSPSHRRYPSLRFRFNQSTQKHRQLIRRSEHSSLEGNTMSGEVVTRDHARRNRMIAIAAGAGSRMVRAPSARASFRAAATVRDWASKTGLRG